MSNIISIADYKAKKAPKVDTDKDLSERIERIKCTADRIKRLMDEISAIKRSKT